MPDPKAQPALHRWGGLNQEIAREQLDVVLEESAPVFVSGLGSPAFIIKAAHARGMKVFGLVGRARQAKREIAAGVDASSRRATTPPATPARSAPSPSFRRSRRLPATRR